MSALFRPVKIGRYELSNRIVMAPMTRSRADNAGVLTEIVSTYYKQRSSAGMIITEATNISPMAKGYIRTPGIFTDAQVAAWKGVTDVVHESGSRIFMQLWHCGRVSHPSHLPGGVQPVAPSAVRAAGQGWTDTGLEDFPIPRAIETSEIPGLVDEYRVATRRALEAGFDGVELHGASGYLPEQFLSSGTNQRTDQYGGSIENRARFMLEILEAITAEAGGDRVGIKLSPEMRYNDIFDATPRDTYTYLIDQFGPFGLAYVHVALFGASIDYHALLRPRFKGAYLMGGGLDRADAEIAIASGKASAAVFGNAFIANPDLPERFRRGAPVNEPDQTTFYTPGEAGYTDYATLDAGG